jgi:pyridoxal phosphate-dependent aminotransferase EpsN
MMTNHSNRIYLSPPHLSGQEGVMLQEALDTNWISSVGPHLTAFEEDFRQYVGSSYEMARPSPKTSLEVKYT